MNDESKKTRREIIAGAVGARATGAMTTRTGRHGEKVSLLGYGAMRLPTTDGGNATGRLGKAPAGYSPAPIDQSAVNAHIDYLLEHGVNYFDTSPAYCMGRSEGVLGKALKRHPRDRYFIATKLSNFAERQYSFEASRQLFEDSLKNLETDYVDFYLLHAVGNGGFSTFKRRYVDNGIIPWLMEQKAKGRIRNIGWSFHGDKAAVDWLLAKHDSGEYVWDFAQIQMNYVDWHHAKEVNDRNLDAEYLYGELDRRGIPIVVMEPLLGGRLAKFNYAVSSKLKGMDPDASLASWAFRFCGTYPRVLTVLSGMTYMKNIEENVATYSPLKPLSQKELDSLEVAARLMLQNKTVPCNLCQYCMPCPYGIDIPGVFDCWNTACTEDRLPDNPTSPSYAANRRRFLADYDREIPDLRQAEHCIGCGRCVPHCPQRIDIPEKMADIDAQVAEWRKEERHV